MNRSRRATDRQRRGGRSPAFLVVGAVLLAIVLAVAALLVAGLPDRAAEVGILAGFSAGGLLAGVLLVSALRTPGWYRQAGSLGTVLLSGGVVLGALVVVIALLPLPAGGEALPPGLRLPLVASGVLIGSGLLVAPAPRLRQAFRERDTSMILAGLGLVVIVVAFLITILFVWH